MRSTTLFQGESLSVYGKRCDARPSDKPFVEAHDGYRVSYVLRGFRRAAKGERKIFQARLAAAH